MNFYSVWGELVIKKPTLGEGNSKEGGVVDLSGSEYNRRPAVSLLTVINGSTVGIWIFKPSRNRVECGFCNFVSNFEIIHSMTQSVTNHTYK